MPMAVATTNSCGQAADKMDGAREKLRRWRLVDLGHSPEGSTLQRR